MNHLLSEVRKHSPSLLTITPSQPEDFVNKISHEYSQDVALVPLTQDRFALVDAADLEILRPYNWTALASGNACYAKAHVGNKAVYMHRLIVFGDKADPRKVDHVNGNGLDNRRKNLRPVTHSQNMQNSVGRKAARKSRFKGVSVREHPLRPYRACIEVSGKQLHLGYFDSECDAASAYNDAAKVHFGTHARLNQISGCEEEREAARIRMMPRKPPASEMSLATVKEKTA